MQSPVRVPRFSYNASNQAKATGPMQFAVVKMWPIFGAYKFDLFGRTAYVYALVATFLSFLVIRRIVNSPFGLSLRGMR